MSLPKLNVLIAYPYWTDAIEQLLLEFEAEFEGKLNLLIDSGAFTAFNSGNPIELKDYLRFIDGLKIKPTRYLALDKIGDEAGTIENLKESYALGYNPLPVFTFSQDHKWLEYYYELSDYIAYGGLVGNKGSAVAKATDNLLKKTGDRKVHLLGYTSMPYIKYFKPYSCDSSSWTSALRYGTVNLYVGNGKQVIYDRKKLQKPCKQFIHRARRYGFNSDLGTKEEHWRGGRGLMAQLNAASWVEMSVDCERKLGTKLYLACASSLDLGTVLNAYRRLYEK